MIKCVTSLESTHRRTLCTRRARSGSDARANWMPQPCGIAHRRHGSRSNPTIYEQLKKYKLLSVNTSEQNWSLRGKKSAVNAPPHTRIYTALRTPSRNPQTGVACDEKQHGAGQPRATRTSQDLHGAHLDAMHAASEQPREVAEQPPPALAEHHRERVDQQARHEQEPHERPRRRRDRLCADARERQPERVAQCRDRDRRDLHRVQSKYRLSERVLREPRMQTR